ncbi:MAG: molecular chaperone [Altererythrobacter sp.]|nr:molecular chaperone [Altererythrobacter sp.]
MKRFYREAAAVEGAVGWHVALDGRLVKTQGGNVLALPNEAMAGLLAAEWAAQGEKLDPRGFSMRDLADYAIDVVATDRAAVVAALMRYAETDTLCYRADPDEPLWKRQQAVWEPLLAACETREGLRLQRVSGVIHRAQDADALAVLGARLEALDPFTLAALTTLASLAASLVIGLAALEPEADGEALWNAANLEEDWQAELWGRDWEAEERREKRKTDFLAAMRFAGARAA